MKKAIAYVSDIILGRTGEVIKRGCQAELIAQYAADNQIDIIGWFEDEIYNENLLTRPGIKALLACDKSYDLVLCERVWALSRNSLALEPFFKELDLRKVSFAAATTMWDCVSQKVRHRFNPSRVHHQSMPPPVMSPPTMSPPTEEKHRIARPAHLHFGYMAK